MMLPQKLSRLLDDWPAKVVSLVAAILIYVFYQINILETKNIAIPLSVYENGNVRVVSITDKNVHVTVKGRKEDVVTLEASDFETYIDISALVEEGEYEVPVKVQLSENATIMESLEVVVEPSEVTVTVAEYASAYVPVVASVAGTPSHGYELGDVMVDPPSIKIFGPKDIVQTIDKLITEPISLNERSESFVLETGIVNDNKMIEFPETSRVSVSVGLLQSTTKKVYTDIPVAVMQPSEPFYVENAELYVKVTLQGSVLNLDDYSIPRNTFYIDCSSLTEEGKYTIPVRNNRVRNGEVVSVYPSELTIYIKKAVEEHHVEETAHVTSQNNEESAQGESVPVPTEQGGIQ